MLTKSFCDGDVSDNSDEWYNQDAKFEILRHIDETLSLVAKCSRKRRWFDNWETSIDVTRKDIRCPAVHFKNIRCNCAKDNHESVPSCTNHPEESSQRNIGNFSIFQILKKINTIDSILR